MYSYTASGSIWYRHFLRYLGVDPASVEWWIGEIDGPTPAPAAVGLPVGVRSVPPGQSVSETGFSAGEVEAIYSPPRPRAYHPVNGPIARLFADFRGIEQELFSHDRGLSAAAPDRLAPRDLAGEPLDRPEPHRRVHCLQRDLHSRAEIVSICHALAGGGAGGHRRRDGEDFHPYGFDPNRGQIEMFAGEAFQLGLTGRQITAAEYFGDFLASG